MPARISPTNWGWTVGDGTVSSTVRSAGKRRMGAVRYSRQGGQGVGDAHRWKPEPFGALADDPEYEQDAAKRDELLERERHCRWGRGKGG
jgi:hypothetical protein